jgi:hypothetical protein
MFRNFGRATVEDLLLPLVFFRKRVHNEELNGLKSSSIIIWEINSSRTTQGVYGAQVKENGSV